MGKGITIAAVVVAVAATVVSLSLYSRLHSQSQASMNAGAARPMPQPAQVAQQLAKPSPEQKARNAASFAMLRGANDEALTGDANGVAEWKAPTGTDQPTICGITPRGRYFIKRNRYGEARYDEPATQMSLSFVNVWAAIGCEKTSPINQSRLVSEQNQEDHFQATHPANSDCLLAEVHAAANHDQAALARSDKDPHYCQDGQFERDEAGSGRSPAGPAH